MAYERQANGLEMLRLSFEGKVFSKDDVPPGFDLGKAIIVSFEGKVVRFFDFSKLSGGYYNLQPVEQPVEAMP